MRRHAPCAFASGKRDVGCDAPTKDYFLKTALRNQGGFCIWKIYILTRLFF